MKKFLYIALLTFLCLSCGPSRHAVVLEMRSPSKSGVDLAGKIVSVVYRNSTDEQTAVISEQMADGFAKAIEKECQTGEGSVGVFSLEDSLGVYSRRDSLINLVMLTGSDLVFLLDAEKTGAPTAAGIPVRISVFCYDGMDKSDRVKAFSGSTNLASSNQLELLSEAEQTGRRLAESFVPQWKTEQFSIAYYDSSKWYEALARAEQFDWKGAMDIWFTLLDTGDMMKRASAEYNIATACYLLGDISLAEQWLDRSDKDNRLPTLSYGLRKRIESRK